MIDVTKPIRAVQGENIYPAEIEAVRPKSVLVKILCPHFTAAPECDDFEYDDQYRWTFSTETGLLIGFENDVDVIRVENVA